MEMSVLRLLSGSEHQCDKCYKDINIVAGAQHIEAGHSQHSHDNSISSEVQESKKSLSSFGKSFVTMGDHSKTFLKLVHINDFHNL
jgi:hypothetical protein